MKTKTAKLYEWILNVSPAKCIVWMVVTVITVALIEVVLFSVASAF